MGSAAAILIIDDHALFRDGLRALVAEDPACEVAGEAATGARGLELAGLHRPEVVLLDLSLPDRNGIDLIPDILQAAPGARVLVVSMNAATESISRAFQSGASGFVSKESAAENLLRGIRAVLRGETYLDPFTAGRVVRRVSRGPGEGAEGPGASLTPREREVLGCILDGERTGEIAARLGIRPKTVENHRASIMAKTGAKSQVDLLRYAARAGILDLESWKG